MDRALYQNTVNRTRLWLLLPLLLVLSQHAGWLHELSHLARAASTHQTTVEPSFGTTDHGVCASCQSFGQLGSALSASASVMGGAGATPCPQTTPRYAQPSAPQPSPRNRGPPQLA